MDPAFERHHAESPAQECPLSGESILTKAIAASSPHQRSRQQSSIPPALLQVAPRRIRSVCLFWVACLVPAWLLPNIFYGTIVDEFPDPLQAGPNIVVIGSRWPCISWRKANAWPPRS